MGLLYSSLPYALWSLLMCFFSMFSLLCSSKSFFVGMKFHQKYPVNFLNSATIQVITTTSNDLWRYQRFLLVYEYHEKTVFPPPLNIFCYIYKFFNYLFCKYCLDGRAPDGQRSFQGKPVISEMLSRIGMGDSRPVFFVDIRCFLNPTDGS